MCCYEKAVQLPFYLAYIYSRAYVGETITCFIIDIACWIMSLTKYKDLLFSFDRVSVTERYMMPVKGAYCLTRSPLYHFVGIEFFCLV